MYAEWMNSGDACVVLLLVKAAMVVVIVVVVTAVVEGALSRVFIQTTVRLSLFTFCAI